MSGNFGVMEFLGSSKRSMSGVCEGTAASAQFCCSGPSKLKKCLHCLYILLLGNTMLVPKHSLLNTERNPTFLAISQYFPNPVLNVRYRQKYCETEFLNKLFQSFIFEKCFQNMMSKIHRSTWLLVTWFPLQKGKKTPTQQSWNYGIWRRNEPLKRVLRLKLVLTVQHGHMALVTFYLYLGIFTSILPADPIIRQQSVLEHHCPKCSVHTVIKIICLHRIAFQFTHQLLDKPQHWKQDKSDGLQILPSAY